MLRANANAKTTTRADFLKQNKFDPTANQDNTEIELIGNSSNAKYCVYPVDGGDSIVIKIQMDAENDPIVRDIYIQNLVDDANTPPTESLMTGRGYHIAHLKEDENEKYFYITDLSVGGGGGTKRKGLQGSTTPVNSDLLNAFDDAFNALKTLEELSVNVSKNEKLNQSKSKASSSDFDLDGFASKVLEEIKSRPHVDKRQKLQAPPRFISMKRPCMLVTNVNNTITFGELLRNHDYTMSTPFCRFIRDLITFSMKTGFTHNDMHIANILYNTEVKYFTLIDYGRANFNTDDYMIHKKMHTIPHINAVEQIQKTLLKGYDNFMLHKIVLGATAADPATKQKQFREAMFNATYTYNQYVCVNDFPHLHMMHDLAGLTKSVLAQLDFFTLPMYRTFREKYVETRWQEIRTAYETSTVRSQIVNRFKKLDILLTQCLGQNDKVITKQLVSDTLDSDFCSNHFAFALAPGYFWMNALERTGVKPEALWRIPAAKHFHRLEPVIFNKLFGANQQQDMKEYAKNIKKCIQIFVNVWMDTCTKLLTDETTGTTMTTTMQQGGVLQNSKYSLIDDIVFAADAADNRDSPTPTPEDLVMTPNFEYVSWAEEAEKHMLNVVTRAKKHISEKSLPYPNQNAACYESKTNTKNLANAFAKCSHINTAAAAGGATSHKSYTIKLERKTQRKYIVKSSKKWYLDEHRNQYRYADAQKTSLTLRTSTK